MRICFQSTSSEVISVPWTQQLPMHCTPQTQIHAPGIYTCPCYYYPNRSGVASRASFVVAADLRSGQMSADHWIKRGTALIMSLDH